ESGNKNISITKIVYPKIGKKFGISCSRVERCIRNSVEGACLKGSIEKLEMFLGDLSDYQNNGKPGNYRFIALLTERVRSLYEPE
ncbi:MAG TPA: hypothetical protein DD727_03155, partial [Clostridiales bacterium]|nr:hypothetical protein [Clostridiales bacterium]